MGDVRVIGAGTYANNLTVAVSGTGHGELWIRRCVAFDISADGLQGDDGQEAAREVILGKIDKMEGSGGGVICVDKNGNIAMEFNTGMMFAHGPPPRTKRNGHRIGKGLPPAFRNHIFHKFVEFLFFQQIFNGHVRILYFNSAGLWPVC